MDIPDSVRLAISSLLYLVAFCLGWTFTSLALFARQFDQKPVTESRLDAAWDKVRYPLRPLYRIVVPSPHSQRPFRSLRGARGQWRLLLGIGAVLTWSALSLVLVFFAGALREQQTVDTLSYGLLLLLSALIVVQNLRVLRFLAETR